MTAEARRRLADILVAAYSGEQAAALAYRGHWRASADPDERERIRAIEDDEWRHRKILARMLGTLGAVPRRASEVRSRWVGLTLGALCHTAGWLLPMVAAGRLERSNVCAYDEAASFAREAGLLELIDELHAMAEVEREHERYFRERTRDHAVIRLLTGGRGALRSRGAQAGEEVAPELRCPEARRR